MVVIMFSNRYFTYLFIAIFVSCFCSISYFASEPKGNIEFYYGPNRGHYFQYCENGDLEITLEFWGELPHDPWLMNYYSSFKKDWRSSDKGDSIPVYRYSFKIGNPAPLPCFDHKLTYTGDSYSAYLENYDVGKRRYFKQPHPKSIDLKNALNMIQGKNLAILCGPGLAVESGVCTRQQCTDDMGIDYNESIDDFIKTLLNHPTKLSEMYKERCERGFFAKPSSAHLAIAQLANEHTSPIFQDNFDYIFEQTDALIVNVGEKIFSEKYLKKDYLSHIDFFFVVGLDGDDRAILGLYKEYNPNGLIISIGDEDPSYLDDLDYTISDSIESLGENIVSHEISELNQ
ncbi:MAG: hypothetical protein JHC93_07520 [Parachlamydiales bacterium]|nr:hypothetical protein [Parachlamydiales bacterium]